MPSNSKVTPPYRYACEDKSWLTAVLARTLVPQIEKRLPSGMPANLITFLSSACLVAMALLLWLAPEWRAFALITGAGLVFAYTLLDMADGQRARRMGSSSPLGEYLDHSLDIVNAVIIAIAVFWIRPSFPPESLVWFLAGLSLTFAAAFVEQCVNGVLRLGHIGPVELLVLVVVYLLSWLIPGAQICWEKPLLGPWSSFDLCIGFVSIGYCVTAATTVVRLRRLPLPLALFTACTLAFPAFLHFGAALWITLLTLVIWMTDFGVRVIRRHLTHESVPWPDFASIVGIAIILLVQRFGGPVPRLLHSIPLLWLAVRLAWNVTKALIAYRCHWVWWHQSSADDPSEGIAATVDPI